MAGGFRVMRPSCWRETRGECVTHRVGWQRGDPPEGLQSREWLVTNGLGGYAAGTPGGLATRRFHGVLVASLPAPAGRVLALAALDDRLRVADGTVVPLSGCDPFAGPTSLPDRSLLRFVLEDGLPIWTHDALDVTVEKRLVLPHLRNTTLVTYRVLQAPGVVTLELRPRFNIRPHEGSVAVLHGRRTTDDGARGFPYEVREDERGVEIVARDAPPLRLAVVGPRPVRLLPAEETIDLVYDVERQRGYDFSGPLASPGRWDVLVAPGESISVVVSTEPWEHVGALPPAEAFAAEQNRRADLVARAHPRLREGFGAELVLAADQFVISPHARIADEALLQAEGYEARSVIAGYHWFTDWGRDTMISLEGLALLTGDARAAAAILRTFAHHVRDGLVPNYFPEGEREAVYHTADASLWFLHALGRYEAATGDVELRRSLMPAVHEIVDHHIRGTRFGIGVDPRDGLLRQGAPGYQLTWMDAKVDGWVVTPRRGKAVEINALWYNALRLLEAWSRADGDDATAQRLRGRGDEVVDSFNRRFWNEDLGHCHDVVDVEGVDGTVDASLRPNQLLAISLPHAVLRPDRWRSVVDVVRDALLTPVGLRTLAPGHPDFRARYDGDLRARDAAYHQGTVWPWLLGPFADAWYRTHGAEGEVRAWITEALAMHLAEACLGQMSEIFDAEAPYNPRGCVAQAWSVAEIIRCLAR